MKQIPNVSHYREVINVYIVACQRGGVSNKPLGQQQDTGPGILPRQKFKKKNELHT